MTPAVLEDRIRERLAMAERLYPDDPHMQRWWLAAQAELAGEGYCAGHVRQRPAGSGPTA